MPAPADAGGARRATVSGTTLCYELSGAGSAVALVHGFTLDHRMWDPQMPALRARHRVLRHDERGFGRSAMPGPEPYSHAADLAALMQHVGIDRAHVVGLSIGAMHALELALDDPKRVRSLVLVDAAGLGGLDFPPEVQALFAAIQGAAATGDVAAAKRMWRAGGWFEVTRERPQAAALLDALLADYSGWHWLHKNPARAPSPPIHERLGQIAVPTQVIVGARDLPYNHRVAEALAAGIAGAEHVVLADAGHLPNMESPEALDAALLGFLARVDAEQT